MPSLPGIIALDIDGTLTTEAHTLPEEVAFFLSDLSSQGWELIFLTGRSFIWGVLPLQNLEFPFFLVVQNGAATVQMPSRAVVGSYYLKDSILSDLDTIVTDPSLITVVESGVTEKDTCYYRLGTPDDKQQEEQLSARRRLVRAGWQGVASFAAEVPCALFPMVKFFGKEAAVHQAVAALKGGHDVTALVLQDPFAVGSSIGLVTHPNANKGQALEDLLIHFGRDKKIIAAGDDHNDISMLRRADISIAMETAPLEVQSEADIIAACAAEKGIIRAVNAARKRLEL